MDIVKMGANVLGGSKGGGGGGGGDGSNAMMNVLKMGKSFSDMMNAKGKRIVDDHYRVTMVLAQS